MNCRYTYLESFSSGDIVESLIESLEHVVFHYPGGPAAGGRRDDGPRVIRSPHQRLRRSSPRPHRVRSSYEQGRSSYRFTELGTPVESTRYRRMIYRTAGIISAFTTETIPGPQQLNLSSPDRKTRIEIFENLAGQICKISKILQILLPLGLSKTKRKAYEYVVYNIWYLAIVSSHCFLYPGPL